MSRRRASLSKFGLKNEFLFKIYYIINISLKYNSKLLREAPCCNSWLIDSCAGSGFSSSGVLSFAASITFKMNSYSNFYYKIKLNFKWFLLQVSSELNESNNLLEASSSKISMPVDSCAGIGCSSSGVLSFAARITFKMSLRQFHIDWNCSRWAPRWAPRSRTRHAQRAVGEPR